MNIKFLFFLTILIIFSLPINKTFSAERITPPINITQNRVMFKIHTKPSNAEVYINNKFIGITPLNKLRAVKGKYSITIEKQGYKKLNTQITLTENNQLITFKLKNKKWEPKNNNLSAKYFIPFFSNLEKEMIFSFFFAYKYHFPDKHVLNNFDFELETGLINMKLKYTEDGIKNQGETTITIFPIAINIHYNFFRRFKYISPYLGIGAGANIINIDAGDYEKTSLIFSIIFGINFFTHWPVSFQFEFRYMWLGKAFIPVEGTSPDLVNKNEEYFFKGILINIGVVGRF